MADRRQIYFYIPREGTRFLPDRRERFDRRAHPGLIRILFADVRQLWARLRA